MESWSSATGNVVMISMQTAPQGRTPTFEQLTIEFGSVVVNIVKGHVRGHVSGHVSGSTLLSPLFHFVSTPLPGAVCGLCGETRSVSGRKNAGWGSGHAEKNRGCVSGRVKSKYMSVSAALFVATTSLESCHSVCACSRPAEPHISNSQFSVSPACPAPFIRSDHDFLLLLPIGLTSQKVREAQSVSGQ